MWVSHKPQPLKWALHAVKHNYSANSCDKVTELNKKIYPDSAQSCQMARTKLSYMINFGLGPHFRNTLLEAINKSRWYSVSFDKSYNDIINKAQMDTVVWYICNNRVVSQYLLQNVWVTPPLSTSKKTFFQLYIP